MKKKGQKVAEKIAADVEVERENLRAYRVKSREGMKTTTITLTEENHRALSHAAIDVGVSMTELVRGLISDFLSKHAKGVKR